MPEETEDLTELLERLESPELMSKDHLEMLVCLD